MRIIILFLLSSALWAADTLNVFGYHWTIPSASDWKIEQQASFQVLHLTTPRDPLPGPRRPIQFALAETPNFLAVTLSADVRPLGHSLLIAFAYNDPAHFDYAHLSIDSAMKQPFHNGIFHVFGGERVRISAPRGPAAFPVADRWYHVQLKFDGTSGRVNIMVDGHPVPALNAVDSSLQSGRVGIGSFDETADFKNVRLAGTLAASH